MVIVKYVVVFLSKHRFYNMTESVALQGVIEGFLEHCFGSALKKVCDFLYYVVVS